MLLNIFTSQQLLCQNIAIMLRQIVSYFTLLARFMSPFDSFNADNFPKLNKKREKTCSVCQTLPNDQSGRDKPDLEWSNLTLLVTFLHLTCIILHSDLTFLADQSSQMEPCKTHPRPILKKSGGQSPQPLFTQPKFDVRPPHPQFFSGNESNFADNVNGEIFFESDTLDSCQPVQVPAAGKNREKKSRPGSVKKTTVQMSQDEDRYKVSHLTRKLRDSHIALARKRAAKHLSAIYVFHSREINKEIIKTLIKSTDGFIKDIRRDFPSENYTDIQ